MAAVRPEAVANEALLLLKVLVGGQFLLEKRLRHEEVRGLAREDRHDEAQARRRLFDFELHIGHDLQLLVDFAAELTELLDERHDAAGGEPVLDADDLADDATRVGIQLLVRHVR